MLRPTRPARQASRIAVLAFVLVVLGGFVWARWSDRDVPVETLAVQTGLPQADTFRAAHEAYLSIERKPAPWNALILSLWLRNTGETPISFVIGTCDFHHAVVLRPNGPVVSRKDERLCGLLGGLAHEVPAGGQQQITDTVLLRSSEARSVPLQSGRYAAFGTLTTPDGVIVARPLLFQVSRRGEIMFK